MSLISLEVTKAENNFRTGKPCKICFSGPQGEFWLKKFVPVGRPTCVEWRAESQDLVDQFYKIGIQAGGQDCGEPPACRDVPTYYGYSRQYSASVADPDGQQTRFSYLIEMLDNDKAPARQPS